MADREYQFQCSLCRWLDVYYPHAYYRSDLGGIRLTKGLAIKAKNIQKHRGHPDFAIYEPSGKFPCLILELKIDESDVFLKRGGIPSGDKGTHLLEQVAMILMLRERGFAVDLTIGQQQTEQMIGRYLDSDFDMACYTGNVSRIIQEATEDQIRMAQAGHLVVYDYIRG
jgi:hypothetical protein